MPKIPTFDARQAAILRRAIRPADSDISLAAARAFLRFQMAQQDCERLHELAVKNQDDLLTTDEREELEGYLSIGMLIDLLQAKARAVLQRAADRSDRAHG